MVTTLSSPISISPHSNGLSAQTPDFRVPGMNVRGVVGPGGMEIEGHVHFNELLPEGAEPIFIEIAAVGVIVHQGSDETEFLNTALQLHCRRHGVLQANARKTPEPRWMLGNARRKEVVAALGRGNR